MSLQGHLSNYTNKEAIMGCTHCRKDDQIISHSQTTQTFEQIITASFRIQGHFSKHNNTHAI